MNQLPFTSQSLNKIPKSTNTYQRVSLKNKENMHKVKKFFSIKIKVSLNQAKTKKACSTS